MAEPFLGEIKMFAGTFAPRGWAFCDGSLLQISQHSALFSLLNNHYGGDGRNTFGLPDLRGRVAVGAGSGPGLTPRLPGQLMGQEHTQLNLGNLPPHNHTATAGEIHITASLQAANANGTTNVPTGNALAKGIAGRDVANIYADTTPTEAMQGLSATATSPSIDVGMTGSGQSFNNMQPFGVVNYIICLEGAFPSRN